MDEIESLPTTSLKRLPYKFIVTHVIYNEILYMIVYNNHYNKYHGFDKLMEQVLYEETKQIELCNESCDMHDVSTRVFEEYVDTINHRKGVIIGVNYNILYDQHTWYYGTISPINGIIADEDMRLVDNTKYYPCDYDDPWYWIYCWQSDHLYLYMYLKINLIQSKQGWHFKPPMGRLQIYVRPDMFKYIKSCDDKSRNDKSCNDKQWVRFRIYSEYEGSLIAITL